MIVAIGSDRDYTFRSFLKACTVRSTSVQPINLRAVVERGNWMIDVLRPRGNFISIDEQIIILDAHRQVFFFRPHTPAVNGGAKHKFEKWKNITLALSVWLNFHQAYAINCPAHDDDNGFKSLHGHRLARAQLNVPEAIISCNQSALTQFCVAGKTIAKSHAGIRANAKLCTEEKIRSYQPSHGPLFLQRFVPGSNLRVHTVGQQAFAVLIKSDYADYRADPRIGAYEPFSLPSDLRQKLVKIAESRNLRLAGWDFKIDPRGKFWCLEVNPMPGYGSYEGPNREVSNAVIDLLEKYFPQ